MQKEVRLVGVAASSLVQRVEEDQQAYNPANKYHSYLGVK
jgi:hypothetical protein